MKINHFFIRCLSAFIVFLLLISSGMSSAHVYAAGDGIVADGVETAVDEASGAYVGQTFSRYRINYEILTLSSGKSRGTVRAIGNTKKKSLEHVSIPDKVKFNGKYYTVTELGPAAFAMGYFNEISIPDTVVSIADACFYGCTSLKAINIGPNVAEIGVGAFSYCNAVDTVTVDDASPYYRAEDGIIYSKKYANLVAAPGACGDVVLNDKTLYIRAYAFEGNRKITSLTCNSGLKKIRANAFYGCSSLKDVFISDTVDSVVNNPFAYCNALTTLTVDDNNEYFASNNNLLLSKSQNVLYCAMAAKGNFTLPSSVNYIGRYSFCGNDSITRITIDSTVSKIYQGAFYDCSNLSYVRFSSRKCTIEVPDDINAVSWIPIFGNTKYFLQFSLPYSKDAGSSGTIESKLKMNAPSGALFTTKK